jgi:hypothetical protein
MPEYLQSVELYKAYVLFHNQNNTTTLSILKGWDSFQWEHNFDMAIEHYVFMQKRNKPFTPKRVINAS